MGKKNKRIRELEEQLSQLQLRYTQEETKSSNNRKGELKPMTFDYSALKPIAVGIIQHVIQDDRLIDETKSGINVLCTDKEFKVINKIAKKFATYLTTDFVENNKPEKTKIAKILVTNDGIITKLAKEITTILPNNEIQSIKMNGDGVSFIIEINDNQSEEEIKETLKKLSN